MGEADASPKLRILAYLPKCLEKLSEKSRTRLQRSRAGRQIGPLGSFRTSYYQPNPRSERYSNPFSDSF
jgi:hypothetical protein